MLFFYKKTPNEVSVYFWQFRDLFVVFLSKDVTFCSKCKIGEGLASSV